MRIEVQESGNGGAKMTIHEYGGHNEKTVILIHPSAVMWDYFEYVIPLIRFLP